MKKTVLLLSFFAVFAFALELTAQGRRSTSTAMTRESDGTYIVNTTTLAKDVRGYRGNTPLKIYIKKDKVVKVEALPNKETPSFFAKVRAQLLSKWDGMKTKKASTAKVDGATGATYSSKAVKENVKRGVNYYMNNK